MKLKLREIRIIKNVTIIELSKRCGLSKSIISDYERDKVSPSILHLEWIAEALGVKINDLFESDVK